MRQREAGCLNHDVVGLRIARKQLFHCWDKIIGDGAADAAIGQLHDVVFGASFLAATFEDIAIYTKIAKFIDDKRDPFAGSVLQHVPDQRSFTGPKKACDDGGGNFSWHFMVSNSGRRWLRLRP